MRHAPPRPHPPRAGLAVALAAWAALAAATSARAEPLLALGQAERQQVLASLSPDEVERSLAEAAPAELLRSVRASLLAMPAYRYRLVKYERLPHETVGPVELVATVREQPYAVRADFVDGLGKGRVALFNAQLDPKRLRVREGGFASIFGALWVNIDDPITRRQSNHGATELGLVFLLDTFQRDWAKADDAGAAGATRELRSERKEYCLRRAVPKSITPVYGRDATVCVELGRLVPTFVEVYDDKGLLERLYYRSVTPVDVADDYFTPARAGL